MEQTQQPHQKKHFNEEETLDRVEKKLDHNMEKIMNKGFIHRFLNNKFMKDILGYRLVNDANNALQPYVKLIFTIIGWISLVSGIIGIFSFLVSLSGLGFMFSLGFGIGIRVLIYVVLAIVFSLLSLLTGIGMIRFKKWAISLAVLGLMVSAISFIISFIPVGLYSYKSYGSFGGSLFSLIITFVIVLLVLKNEHMFKN